MGRHNLMPEEMEAEESLLDVGQNDLTQEELDERQPPPGWACGREIGSVVPSRDEHHQTELTPAQLTVVHDLFNQIDRNGSGTLDREECFLFCNQHLAMTQRMMHQLDTNQDGVVSIREWENLFLEFKNKSFLPK